MSRLNGPKVHVSFPSNMTKNTRGLIEIGLNRRQFKSYNHGTSAASEKLRNQVNELRDSFWSIFPKAAVSVVMQMELP